MTAYRPRIWLGLGLSVLAAGPAVAEGAGCEKPALQGSAEVGEAGEAGESGETGAATAEDRALLLDRMAAQIAAAAMARADGDAESAGILIAAATDEGPASLARRGQRHEVALEAALAPLAATPTDPAAQAQAEHAIEAVLGALPGAPKPLSRVHRAERLLSAALSAYGAALDCGRLADRAAYFEARAMVVRSAALVAGLPQASAVTAAVAPLLALLPATPPATMPPIGQVSALVSNALLEASDLLR